MEKSKRIYYIIKIINTSLKGIFVKSSTDLTLYLFKNFLNLLELQIEIFYNVLVQKVQG